MKESLQAGALRLQAALISRPTVQTNAAGPNPGRCLGFLLLGALRADWLTRSAHHRYLAGFSPAWRLSRGSCMRRAHHAAVLRCRPTPPIQGPAFSKAVGYPIEDDSNDEQLLLQHCCLLGSTWRCNTCGEQFCSHHQHRTDLGHNTECLSCEADRKTREKHAPSAAGSWRVTLDRAAQTATHIHVARTEVVKTTWRADGSIEFDLASDDSVIANPRQTITVDASGKSCFTDRTGEVVEITFTMSRPLIPRDLNAELPA